MIRYAYLWRDEHRQGRQEGRKGRPCAVILVTADDDGERNVTVLPVTHAPPTNLGLAVEIPHATKQRLGLDDERSWILLTKANRFAWVDIASLRRHEADLETSETKLKFCKSKSEWLQKRVKEGLPYFSLHRDCPRLSLPFLSSKGYATSLGSLP